MNPKGRIAIATRKEKFLRTSPYKELSVCFILLITLTSFILATFTFVILADTSYEVSYVLSNWNTKPIIDIVGISAGSSCPADYTKLSYNDEMSPSVSKGACACSGYIYASKSDTCSEEELASGYCVTDPAVAGIALNHWRKTDICIAKSSEASVTWSKRGFSKSERPVPAADGSCPTGYRKCGSGLNYDDGRAVCILVAEKCPYTSLVVALTGTVFPTNSYYSSVIDFGDGYTLYGRRGEVAGELPLLGIWPALSDVTSAATNYPVPGEVNRRGICMCKEEIEDCRQVLKPKQISPKFSSGTSSDYFMDYSGNGYGLSPACDESDTRFARIDSVTLETFFLNNVEINVADCVSGGRTLYPTSSSSYVSTYDPDYYYSSIPAPYGGYSSATGYSAVSSCALNDYICYGVLGQTLCGQHVHAAHWFSGFSVSYGLFAEREIYWDTACPVSKSDVNYQHVDVDNIVLGQLSLIIINTVIGFFGILVQIFSLLKHWKWLNFRDTHDKPQFEEIVSVPMNLMKLIPVIVLLVFLTRAYRTYREISENDCSDGVTNSSFDVFGKKLPEIHRSTVAVLCLDIVLFVVGMFLMFRKWAENRSLNHRTRYDAKNRVAIEFDVPEERGEIVSACFHGKYMFSLVEELETGSKIFIYSDGEVWSSLEARVRYDEEFASHYREGHHLDQRTVEMNQRYSMNDSYGQNFQQNFYEHNARVSLSVVGLAPNGPPPPPATTTTGHVTHVMTEDSRGSYHSVPTIPVVSQNVVAGVIVAHSSDVIASAPKDGEVSQQPAVSPSDRNIASIPVPPSIPPAASAIHRRADEVSSAANPDIGQAEHISPRSTVPDGSSSGSSEPPRASVSTSSTYSTDTSKRLSIRGYVALPTEDSRPGVPVVGTVQPVPSPRSHPNDVGKMQPLVQGTVSTPSSVASPRPILSGTIVAPASNSPRTGVIVTSTATSPTTSNASSSPTFSPNSAVGTTGIVLQGTVAKSNGAY